MEGPHHEADLVLRHHVAVQLARCVGEVVGQLLQPLLVRAPVAHRDEQARCAVQLCAAPGHLGADAVHVVAHVDAVGHRALVGIVLHDVAAEEADGLRRGGCGQSDQARVEVLQHLAPNVVDRAMALVHDDEVECLDGKRRVVDHRQRLLREPPARLEHRVLFIRLVVLGLALEDRVEPLDGRDHHLGGGLDRIPARVLHRVLVGEAVAVVGAGVALELVVGLVPKGVAVDEEKNPFRAREPDQPLAERRRRMRFAATRGHLDQRSRQTLRERFFEVLDRLPLHRPQIARLARRHAAQAAAHLRLQACQAYQLLRPMEGEHFPAARVGLEAVGELRHRTRGFVGEGRRAAPCRKVRRHAECVLPALNLHALERVALGLCFDQTDHLAAGVEQIVNRAGIQREFANRDGATRGKVHLLVVLHKPTGRFELAVDIRSGLLFWCHAAVPPP